MYIWKYWKKNFVKKKYEDSYYDDAGSSKAIEKLMVGEKRGEQNEKQKSLCNNFLWCCSSMNIVLGIITSALGIPLYLDTLGTVLSAAILGPLPGIIVGALSNIITGLIYSVSDIPFCLVNMAVGLIVGLVAKNGNSESFLQ